MKSPACCTTICAELRSPMFDLAEPRPSGACCCCPKRRDGKGDETDESNSGTGDADSPPRRLDVVKTFSPAPRPAYVLAKLSLLAWVTSMMYISIDTHRHPSFWLAYLTHWGLVVTLAYFITSVASAIYLAFRPPEDAGTLEGGLGLFLKTNWALFSIATPSQVMVTVLFWALEFDGTSDYWYKTIMTHGGIMLIVMFDGFVLSRIPIRMRQIGLYALFGIAYILWTVIHAFSGIGNPYAEDGNKDDDAIYQSMKWKGNPAGAAIMSVIVVFVLIPAIGLFCRALSRVLPRRLCDEEQTFKRGSEDGQQESFQNDEEGGGAVVY